MNLQILIKENDGLLVYDKSSFPFKTFQNEIGDFEELEGVLNFQIEEQYCAVASNSIESDLFGLFYSVNDFLEFDFASAPLDNEKTTFKYELFDGSNVKLEFNDSEWLINQDTFLGVILSSSFDFFEALLKNQENEQYKMNLRIIESLAIRLKLTDKLDGLKQSRLS